jgi:hypothetical protein
MVDLLLLGLVALFPLGLMATSRRRWQDDPECGSMGWLAIPIDYRWNVGDQTMLKNTMRGILGLVLTAAATWLANYLVDRMFGPDEEAAWPG